jgi:hypothetical protein
MLGMRVAPHQPARMTQAVDADSPIRERGRTHCTDPVNTVSPSQGLPMEASGP